ncbi:50S ribosomal protein L16 [Candidatus Beckwithbacteria bacterium CG22_combo_CG10-13_8_21_14_all_01_47_9]|uniref:Large ribosomal subunit protein uL16 n=5 Tax=Candidatus Beckwithiibacteriota TaxID=1752726 RepID=A0A2H0E2G3_9BACT|nr:MAG: 50S ribosomal protein L16 [Candidatus Beckwithbacteria bacterium CG1_02_47_37]PIP52433.1 MAG: 50S ribosomal protein L16 [Candidatus Beckwithbacteria bacterium CG23_combo_of_CG06-09_8_20_14_all_47_9]PIP88000.1 MAG: 50S ribosomal protein L16 [Candidatus Beckwithbacteria bacterium CG22_combo_CG10-13_8_21_14_all_01_47_9]PJA21775.1 MAG: 50S ribosomal protein L16 [Candidatus Beckwithbacteria bacterium CG_4_10_14_0_2_um_filter_47_25]PJC66509.1 MAG: 50S ribosomal protein L16 [Candidatus Beckwit
MLQPKRSKYRKQFRGTMAGNANSGNTVSFGDYGLKSLDRGWLTARQIEAARKTIAHATKRIGKVWLRVFPDKPYTKKGAGVRMGGGKGEIEGYVCVIRPGRILFELGGVSAELARESFRLAGRKLALKTKVVARL